GGGGAAGATAGFVGLKGHHGRAHMARAVIDGVAALHAWHLKRLAAHGLGVPGRVAALGGGARDPRLVRLLADFLGHPVERCGDDETGARGAAGYAALSQGASADEALPVRCVTEAPDATTAQAHAEFHSEFEALIGNMAPAFAQLAGRAP
ncbi:FGGY-family carbohydrate kinase, partial [Achromobacter marplatensis]|uniref:FGGY-family carbohydrate kinase n=1 Tax=Achromobacter marplatensis TaxID=470868 RepID=UPI0039EE2784